MYSLRPEKQAGRYTYVSFKRETSRVPAVGPFQKQTPTDGLMKFGKDIYRKAGESRSVNPEHFSEKLKDWIQRFHDCNPFLHKEIGSRRHDLVGHILGGGMLTDAGETVAGVVGLVLSTIQGLPADEEHTIVRLDTEKGTIKRGRGAGEIRVPTFKRFKEEALWWEEYDEIPVSQTISDEQLRELYDYAVILLGRYIQLWGVEPGKNILGSDNPGSGIIRKNILDQVL